MTPKEILNKVSEVLKAAFSDQPQVPPAEPKEPVKMSTDVTLKDGTVVQVDELKVGGKVTKEGQPVADAEHVLEDGTVIVTVGGAITEIKQPEPAQTVDVEDMKKDLTAKFSAIEDGYKAKFEAQEKKFEALKESIEKLNEAVLLMAEQSVKTPKEPVAPVAATENFKKVLESRGKI